MSQERDLRGFEKTGQEQLTPKEYVREVPVTPSSPQQQSPRKAA